MSQGTYGIIAGTNFNFGTTGLGTCVGIIMTLQDGTNLCGHMDADYEPTKAQQVQFEASVTVLLNNTLPAGNAPTGIFYATPGGSRASQYSVSALTTWAQGYGLGVVGSNRSAIYIDATGVQTTDQNVSDGANQVNTGPFTVQ